MEGVIGNEKPVRVRFCQQALGFPRSFLIEKNLQHDIGIQQ